MIYSLDKRKLETRGDFWIADNASIIGSVILEHNATIWFGAVLRGDNDLITIGEGSNVQDGSVLHTDEGVKLTLGKGVTVGHQVMLHGCHIGDETLIGIKSTVLNHVRIGRQCLIGAHSLITEGKEIPDRSLVMGAPAKIIRQLTDEEVIRVRRNAEHYVEKMAYYKQHLKAQR